MKRLAWHVPGTEPQKISGNRRHPSKTRQVWKAVLRPQSGDIGSMQEWQLPVITLEVRLARVARLQLLHIPSLSFSSSLSHSRLFFTNCFWLSKFRSFSLLLFYLLPRRNCLQP